MADEWVAMRNWQKFQYYGQRRPMWIVNHTELLHDDNYLDLTEHQALLLHRLWLSYASARAQLRLTTASLSRHTGLRVMRRDIEALVQAGFVEILHAPRMQDAFPRARGEEDIKTRDIKSVVEKALAKATIEEHDDENLESREEQDRTFQGLPRAAPPAEMERLDEFIRSVLP